MNNAEQVLGYMNQLGYVHCLECALGNAERESLREPHASWEPMRRHNLASDADECDGCHRRLLAISAAAVKHDPYLSDCQCESCRSRKPLRYGRRRAGSY